MSKPFPDGRPAPDTKLGNEARTTLSRLRRWEKKLAEAAEHVEVEQAALAELHRKACERFGRNLPTDALLLDVLELVDVEEGDRWLWRGMRNNYGVPTLRVRRPGARTMGESTVVRFLAVALGVIPEDAWGMLYPTNGDKEDINPWHRTLREADHPTGNPNRYGFSLPSGEAD